MKTKFFVLAMLLVFPVAAYSVDESISQPIPMFLTPPPYAEYVTIADMEKVQWGNPIMDVALQTSATPMRMAGEGETDGGDIKLYNIVKYIAPGSRLKVFPYNQYYGELARLAKVPDHVDVDLDRLVLMKFELFLSDSYATKKKQKRLALASEGPGYDQVTMVLFARIIQEDDQTKKENLLFHGIGGVLSSPFRLEFSATAPEVTSITERCVQRACSEFQDVDIVSAQGWDDAFQEDHSGTPQFDKSVSEWRWGDWESGKCNWWEFFTCDDEKIDGVWWHKHN